MKRVLVATIVAILAATVLPYAQSDQVIPATDAEFASMWFVELSNPPTSEGTGVAALEREESDFHAAATGARIQYTEKKHFRELWNGLTIRANGRNADKLRGLPGIAAVYPVMKVHVAQEDGQPGNVIDLITAVKMTGVDIAQNELGLTGRSVRVAVMDTGIDYNHPDLGGCFGPSCRVEKGFD